jgi:hypothetical protein
MANRLHLAGILQYSKPIYKEIEDYLLKIYAAMFIPALEAEADRGDEHLHGIRLSMQALREAVQQLRDGPSQQAWDELVPMLQRLMMAGLLAQYRIRPDRLFRYLQTGDESGAKKYLDRIEKMADDLQEEAEKGLGQQAKEMRKDIKEWEPYFEEGVLEDLKERAKQRKGPELEIEFDEEQFPFLGEKFQRHVRGARGSDATMFDDMPSMKVVVAQMPDPQMMGAWSSSTNELLVGIPGFAPFKTVKKNLERTLQHELRHMSQTLMAKALGITQVEIVDGELVPVYKESPGMGPRETLNLDIVQALRMDIPIPEGLPPEKRKKAEERARQLQAKRTELMQKRKLGSRRAIYNLDDLEFYTHLADRVIEFEDILEEVKDLTPAQKKTALNLYTGALVVPRDVAKFLEEPEKTSPDRTKKAKAWIQKHDPDMGILPIAHGPDAYFRHLRKYSRPKWEKAVKEFAKVIQPQLGTDEKPTGLQDLWKEFLDERYDGGKEKIRNPNLDTRDSHPEISVSYLMKQDDSDYKTDRMKIRREFASWRQRKKGPQKGAPDLFAQPPSATRP